MTDDKTPPPLGDPYQNAVTRIAMSAPGMIPIVGPVVQAAIQELIPNVRLNRFETYIQYLQDRIDELKLKAVLETPEGLDTFEEGMWQSARAVSEKRKRHIVELTAKALTAEETERLQARHYMRILTQLGDDEIALLTKMARQESFVFNGTLIPLYEPHLNSLGLLAVISEDYGTLDNENTTVGSLKEYGITEIGKEFVAYLSLPDDIT